MIVVNLIGPPGAGKSTMAAEIFARLKWQGIECELVTEFAKDLTWEHRFETLKNQIYVFSKQFHKIHRLIGKVDLVITDSPLILSIYYNNKYCDVNFTRLNPLVLEQHYRFKNFNYFIERVKEYNPKGRNETEEESNQIGTELKEMMDKYHIKYSSIKGTEENVPLIVKDIMKRGATWLNIEKNQ